MGANISKYPFSRIIVKSINKFALSVMSITLDHIFACQYLIIGAVIQQGNVILDSNMDCWYFCISYFKLEYL